jgi:hypothetical protein
MRAEFALLCRDVRDVSAPVDLYAAGIDTVWFADLPGVVKLFLVVQLRGSVAELGTDVTHNFEVYVIGPGPQSLFDLHFDFRGPRPKSTA